MSEHADYIRRQAYAEERAKSERTLDRLAYERPRQWIDEENDPLVKSDRMMRAARGEPPAALEPDVDIVAVVYNLLAAHKAEVKAEIASLRDWIGSLDDTLAMHREAIAPAIAEVVGHAIDEEVDRKITAAVGELRAEMTVMRAVDSGKVDDVIDLPPLPLVTKTNGHAQ